MKRSSLAILLVLLAAAAPARAQDIGNTTEQRLAWAIARYNDLRIEEAQPVLLNIISPGYLQPVSPTERVNAYKYLGLCYVAQGDRETAIGYFVAALDFDPFTDLDVQQFASAELGAFAEAKQRLFKIALAPLRSRVVVPRSDTAAFRFRIITTHRANIRVTLASQTDPSRNEILLDGAHDGIRELTWRGTWRGDSLPPPGVYEISVTGQSSRPEVASQAVTERLLFRIDHALEPLEDTLPTFTIGAQLLPEHYPAIGPWLDLGIGALIAGSALAMPAFVLDGNDLGSTWQAHAGAAMGAGVISAGISFWYRRSTQRAIAANNAENMRRRAARDAFNAQVQARNRDRVARTILVIQPVAR